MKTVIEELIEELKANDVAHGMYWIKQPDVFFEKYLEKEKEQIIDAANQKIFGDITFTGSDEVITKGENYYNQTYNQNK
jgi:hypothetical protein